MAEGEFVIETQRFYVRQERPQIFVLVISTDRHFGFATDDSFRRAVEHVEFCAFDVELDIVDARQIFSCNVSVQVNEAGN